MSKGTLLRQHNFSERETHPGTVLQEDVPEPNSGEQIIITNLLMFECKRHKLITLVPPAITNYTSETHHCYDVCHPPIFKTSWTLFSDQNPVLRKHPRQMHRTPFQAILVDRAGSLSRREGLQKGKLCVCALQGPGFGAQNPAKIKIRYFYLISLIIDTCQK